MKQYAMHKAKTQLSRLAAEAEAGEDVVIMRGRKPTVRLVAVSAPTAKRIPGRLRDVIGEIQNSFFDPLPEKSSDLERRRKDVLMRVLLDTHVFIWWVRNDRLLSNAALGAIENRANEIFVSAATAREIATKYRLGRLPDVKSLAINFSREIQREGFAPLSVSVDHGLVAGSLPGNHGDPFDRMLIAQALEEKLAVVSSEKIFDRFNVARIW